MTPVEYFKRLTSLVADINGILARYGIPPIEGSDVTVTDRTVSDLSSPHPKLSDGITNFLWPSVDSDEVYHYTYKGAAESILSTGVFRFMNIAKRANEGEIVTFCETHNLTGYLEKDANGEPTYKNLIMPNTFYASFAGTDLTETQETQLWNDFAAPDGVRFRLAITANNPNFRKMRYEQVIGTPIAVLADLVQCLRDKYHREFVLKGISRLCSFYLSGADYGHENEYRALHRTWVGFGPQPIGSGASSYIELPLNRMTECGYMIKVLEVHSTQKPAHMPANCVFSKRGA